MRLEPLDLVTVRLHRQLAQHCLFLIDRHRRVRRLVGVDTDEHHRVPPSVSWEATSGTPDEICVLASFEPRRGQEPGGWHFVTRSQPSDGRHFQNQPAELLRR